MACPICCRRIPLSQATTADRPPYYPFCSERCKLIDLGAWLDENYVIHAGPDSEESQISESEPYEES